MSRQGQQHLAQLPVLQHSFKVPQLLQGVLHCLAVRPSKVPVLPNALLAAVQQEEHGVPTGLTVQEKCDKA
jgi:hypothetical protein